jgi:hypothetical protein
MRALILIAGAALALGACGNNDQSDNTANVDENLAAEGTTANDVTAIDAVTGDAANMAADVNFENEITNLDSNAPSPVTGNAPAPSRPAPHKVPRSQPAPKPAPKAATPAPTTNTGM